MIQVVLFTGTTRLCDYYQDLRTRNLIMDQDNNTDYIDISIEHYRNTYIVLEVIYYIIALLIIFLNGLTIVAISKFKNLKSGINYLIFSLSIADLSLGFTIPLCAMSLHGISGKICNVCFYFIATSLSVSITTIVAIALERFYAVVYPLRHRVKMSRKVVIAGIVLIWLLETTIVLVNILVHEPEFWYLLHVWNIQMAVNSTCYPCEYLHHYLYCCLHKDVPSGS